MEHKLRQGCACVHACVHARVYLVWVKVHVRGRISTCTSVLLYLARPLPRVLSLYTWHCTTFKLLPLPGLAFKSACTYQGNCVQTGRGTISVMKIRTFKHEPALFNWGGKEAYKRGL